MYFHLQSKQVFSVADMADATKSSNYVNKSKTFFRFLNLSNLFSEGQVTGRGCSTKDKVFYKECETHSYGDQVGSLQSLLLGQVFKKVLAKFILFSIGQFHKINDD